MEAALEQRRQLAGEPAPRVPGRFENASGSIKFTVLQNLITGAFELTAVGNIDF